MEVEAKNRDVEECYFKFFIFRALSILLVKDVLICLNSCILDENICT